MKALRYLSVAVIFAYLGLFVPSPASATAANGAIAVEPSTGIAAYWIDASDEASAKANALRECNKATNGANDCVIAVYFSQHLCGSFAEDANHTIKSGLGNTLAEAAGNAAAALPNGIVVATKCNSSLQIAGTPTAFVPEPIRVRSSVADFDTSPVVVYADSIRSRDDHTYLQCLSYRNISPKTAVAVKFRFELMDNFNAKLQSFSAENDGKYSPGINIDDICWHGDLWSADQIRQMKAEKITVASVRFDDDTIWSPGAGWTKAYSTAGVPLPTPQVIAANNVPGPPQPLGPFVTPATPSPGTSAAPISIGGASGGGGSFTPTGTAYGAIAMNPGSHAVGVATDAGSDDAAVYDAMSKCNAKSGSGSDCKIILHFSGAASKCAAVAVDGNVYGTGVGADLNNTIATALANLRANGGNIGNNIVASPCNSR